MDFMALKDNSTQFRRANWWLHNVNLRTTLKEIKQILDLPHMVSKRGSNPQSAGQIYLWLDILSNLTFFH